MPGCDHKALDFVGEQRTDEGVNTYYTCRSCGNLLVVTPSNKVFGFKGVQRTQPAQMGMQSKS